MEKLSCSLCGSYKVVRKDGYRVCMTCGFRVENKNFNVFDEDHRSKAYKSTYESHGGIKSVASTANTVKPVASGTNLSEANNSGRSKARVSGIIKIIVILVVVSQMGFYGLNAIIISSGGNQEDSFSTSVDMVDWFDDSASYDFLDICDEDGYIRGIEWGKDESEVEDILADIYGEDSDCYSLESTDEGVDYIREYDITFCDSYSGYIVYDFNDNEELETVYASMDIDDELDSDDVEYIRDYLIDYFNEMYGENYNMVMENMIYYQWMTVNTEIIMQVEDDSVYILLEKNEYTE